MREPLVKPATTQDNSEIHMVDLRGLHARMEQELDEAMKQVVHTSAFIRGHFVESFEKDLNAKMNLDGHVIGVGNGTDALSLALRAAEIQEGDEVIVPDFSFISSAEVVSELGAIPVFADINPETFQLDQESAEKARTVRTKAVIVVHLFGQCADMDALLPWAETHGLKVIEDNAQSLGAEWRGRHVSGMAGMMGLMGTTSFFPSKNLGAMGDGGAVLTQNPQLADRIRRLANHGSETKYHHTEIGVNSRLDGLQASILSAKLTQWTDMVARRQAAANRYDELIASSSDMKALVSSPVREGRSTHLFHQYCVLLSKGCDRKALVSNLQNAGIPTAVYYPTPLSSQPAFESGGGRTVEGGTPCAHEVAGRILALPMHTELTFGQQSRVVEELFRLLSSR